MAFQQPLNLIQKLYVDQRDVFWLIMLQYKGMPFKRDIDREVVLGSFCVQKVQQYCQIPFRLFFLEQILKQNLSCALYHYAQEHWKDQWEWFTHCEIEPGDFYDWSGCSWSPPEMSNLAEEYISWTTYDSNEYLLYVAIKNGYWSIISYFNHSRDAAFYIMKIAAMYGRLEILEKLYDPKDAGLTLRYMLYPAAVHGQLDVVKWVYNKHIVERNTNWYHNSSALDERNVHNHGEYLKNNRFMVITFNNGHTHVLDWILKNCHDWDLEDCIDTAIKTAIQKDDSYMLEWFDN